MSSIVLPPQLSADQISLLVAAGEAVATSAADELDASAVTAVGPLSMVELGLAVARRRRLGRGPLALRAPRDELAAAFLDEVGFARLLAGEDPTRRRADTLEIRQMLVHDRLYTERIADVLVERVKGYDEDASHLVHLCLNELLQNVFEWADSPDGAFVHCRWYRRDANVRIAVADGGVGIPASLRRGAVQRLQRESDAAVIVAAVTRPRLTSSPQASRGLGLKLVRDVVATRGGRLVVASHSAIVTFGPGDAVRHRRCEHLRGTAIEIDFRPHTSGISEEAIL